MTTETKVADWIKVGVKGKTRGGDDYEVIAVEPRADRPVIVLVGSATDALRGDGSVWSDGPYASDLLPPTRTVYVNFYYGRTLASYHASETLARAACCGDAIAIAVPVEIPHD